MSTKELLHRVVDELPEEQARALLELAESLPLRREAEEWRAFARQQMSRLWGPDEPEYSLADLKPELNP